MIKIAQIGIGHDHAIVTMDSIIRNSDIFEFVGFCECEDEAHARALREKMCPTARELTLKEILEDESITAVAVETNDEFLTKYALMAARFGKHVHMDKPGSQDHKEFTETAETLKKQGKVFHLGYMYRYNPVLKEIFALKDSLGTIYSVEAHMDCEHLEEKRRWLNKFKGGMTCYLGCHLIDLVYRLQGEPNEVLPLSVSTDGVADADLGFAVFKYDNGISFIKACANEVGGFNRRQLVINAENATVEVRPLEWYADASYSNLETEYGIVYKKVGDNSWAKKRDIKKCPPFNRYDGMMRAFYSYVTGEKKNPFDYDFEIALHSLILRACGM